MKTSLLLTGSCRLLLLQILLGALVFEVKAELPAAPNGQIEVSLGGKAFALLPASMSGFVDAWVAADAHFSRQTVDWGRTLAWFDAPGFEVRGVANDGATGWATFASGPDQAPPGAFRFLQRQVRPPPVAVS